MAKTKTWVFEKKKKKLDSNSLQNLYISFLHFLVFKTPQANKTNPKQYNSNPETNYPKMEELGSP